MVEEAERYVHTYIGAAGSAIRTCIPIPCRTSRPLPLYGDGIMPIVSSILRIPGPRHDTWEPSSNACVAIRYVQMASKYPPIHNWILQRASVFRLILLEDRRIPDDDRHSGANWAYATMNIICNF